MTPVAVNSVFWIDAPADKTDEQYLTPETFNYNSPGIFHI